MPLTFNKPITDIVKTRLSVRTYSAQPVSTAVKQSITIYIDTLTNPFQAKVTFRLLQTETSANATKLGTYGVIKGARDFVGASVQPSDLALEALGYEFERLILYATSLDLGTCWLGGTFKRSEFARAMAIQKDDLFPAISPIGFAADRRSLTETMMRRMAKGDTRKNWTALFFDQNFATPLTPDAAGDFALALEMVRLAPSASNKQPWRIVKDHDKLHFYEYKSPAYSKAFAYDIQRIDIGIAACHFELTCLEQGQKGHFEKLTAPDVALPENIIYAFSWLAEVLGS